MENLSKTRRGRSSKDYNKGSLIDELVIVGLVLIACYISYLAFNAQQEHTRVQNEKTEIVMTKDELQARVHQLESLNKQKQSEIDNLNAQLKDLSYLKRLQKDIARIFDGGKD